MYHHKSNTLQFELTCNDYEDFCDQRYDTDLKIAACRVSLIFYINIITLNYLRRERCVKIITFKMCT